MGRWSDIAEWRGPTENQSGRMVEYRGVVLHVMQGSYEGSIAWGKNPDSNVSFHFATAKDGRCGQLVDTDTIAWTQVSGNGHWLSIENEDYSGNPLSADQVEKCAQIYARAVREYGIPLQITDSPSGRGLGWHGMGGASWGGHYDCPGEPIKAQRQQILDRAAQILGGEGDDMTPEQAAALDRTDKRVTTLLYDAPTTIGADWAPAGERNMLHERLNAMQAQIDALTGGGVSGPVNLTDEAVAKVADAVADEQANRLAE